MSIDTFLLSADTTDLNYPEVRPTLDLNFARVKALDPRITFTRSSGGSYVGADGLIKLAGVNVPRFDHDPVTGESLGLLVEESRSNLLQRSEEFDNASWGKQNSHPVTANSVSAPDGTLTADTFTRTALDQFVYQSVTVTGTYTLSAWVRSANPSGSFVMQPYNPTDGNPGVTTFTATNIWQRFSITSTVTTNSAWYPCITSNINETFYVWGAQLEAGAFPTSYIPTVASTRTRAADNASITGKNFSEWYRQDEGTLMIGARRNYAGNFVGYPGVATINDGTSNNAIGFYGALGSIQFTNYGLVVSGGVYYTDYVARSIPTTAPFKMIQALKRNSSIFGTDGVMTTADTSVEMPVGVNQLIIGGNWGGTINRLTYYPKALPPSNLQALTR